MNISCRANFIVGTGRCGSTLLSNLLRDHSNVLSLSELFTVAGGREALHGDQLDGATARRRLGEVGPHSWQLLSSAGPVAELLGQVPPTREQAQPLRLIPLPHLVEDDRELSRALLQFVESLPRRPTSTTYQHIFSWIQHWFDKGQWVERSGGSLEYLDRLIELWPTARFIHLHRSGVDCSRSMSRHPFFRARVGALAQRRGERLLLSATDKSNTTIPLDRFGAYWSAVTLRGLHLLSALPPRQVMHIDYDLLVRRPAQTLGEVLRFLGEPAPNKDACQQIHERVVNAGRGRPKSWDLDEEQQRTLERVCRPGQRALQQLRRSQPGKPPNIPDTA